MGLVDLKQLQNSGCRYNQRVKNAFELHVGTFNTKQRQDTDFRGSVDAALGLVQWVSPMLVFPMISGAFGFMDFSWTSSSKVAGDTQVTLSPKKVRVCGFDVSAINCGQRGC